MARKQYGFYSNPQRFVFERCGLNSSDLLKYWPAKQKPKSNCSAWCKQQTMTDGFIVSSTITTVAAMNVTNNTVATSHWQHSLKTDRQRETVW